MNIVGIIPARFASTRFPGKPLALIQGKPMIQHVYEQSVRANTLSEVYVATDDLRIENAVKKFNGRVIMTSAKHKSGTDRCMEALEKLENEGKSFDVLVNIQGDEPFIHSEQINSVTSSFHDKDVVIATLAKKIGTNAELFNPNVTKVIFDFNGNAICFSRHPIPFIKNLERDKWLMNYNFYKHIGIYAYRTKTLRNITRLGISPLENAESLEQLRWIENGYKIHIEVTDLESIAVDTPEDLLKFLNNPLNHP
jgi:3-deoxy-manno-octulosonate cytidylyltransferase (CMP-KDO synthetase)